MGVDCTCTLFTALFLILRMGLMSWNFLPFFKFTMKFMKIPKIVLNAVILDEWTTKFVKLMSLFEIVVHQSILKRDIFWHIRYYVGVSSSKRWSSSKRQALLGLRYLGATKLNLFVHFATKMFRLTNYYLKQFAKSTIKD